MVSEYLNGSLVSMPLNRDHSVSLHCQPHHASLLCGILGGGDTERNDTMVGTCLC